VSLDDPGKTMKLLKMLLERATIMKRRSHLITIAKSDGL